MVRDSLEGEERGTTVGKSAKSPMRSSLIVNRFQPDPLLLWKGFSGFHIKKNGKEKKKG